MKARLITAFTIIILVPMLIISLIITFRITEILNEETDDKLSYTLFTMSKMISEDIQAINNRINALKVDPNMIEGVGFKDEKQFMGLLNSAKEELGLESAVVYSWKEGMKTIDSDGHFYIIEETIQPNLDEETESEEPIAKETYRKLVYIQEGLLRERDKIIGVLRFQKTFNDDYLLKKVENFKRLAGIQAGIFHGKTSMATTYGQTIQLNTKPADLIDIDLTVNKIEYQAKLGRITDTILNQEENNLHLLVALSQEEANSTLNGIIFLIAMVASISTIVAIFLGFLVARWLADRMNRTVTVVDRIAGGDLTEVIEKQKQPFLFRKDEMSMVLESVGSMSEELINIVKRTMRSVDVLVEVSEELNESNEQLSQRAEIQASSIEQISATLEQMTSTIKSTADNSKKVRDLVEDTNTKIREGESIIEEAISAMNLISESSREISNITDVVDDIAFQTNLLSLNASVEAARAGEQGKGFAVVANEVRNLAQLSTNAVNNIQKLTQNTTEKVEKGETLVNMSGDILKEIVESMDEVSISMQEVAVASAEQEVGIHHVNEAVQQIDSMIQKNTILADRTMVLSNRMTGLANEIQNLMSFFKLKQSEYEELQRKKTEEFDEISDEELFSGDIQSEIIKPDKISRESDETDSFSDDNAYEKFTFEEESEEDDLFAEAKKKDAGDKDKGGDDSDNEGISI
jgi:methyl-accepting chemotaxis protein